MYDITIVGHDAHIVPQSQQDFTLTPCWGDGVQSIEWFVKNPKDRYWSANLSTDHVDIGRELTYKEAINMVKSGKSVFTVTKSEAKNLAKAAYSNKTSVGPEIHNKNSQGEKKRVLLLPLSCV